MQEAFHSIFYYDRIIYCKNTKYDVSHTLFIILMWKPYLNQQKRLQGIA